MSLEDLIVIANNSSITVNATCDGKRVKSATVKCGAC